jgi:soluble lytic murein transglycosylase-like protein
MLARLLALLLVAALCAVGAAAAAKPHRARILERIATRRALPRIPALPAGGVVRAHRCPIPEQFRPAFRVAARDTGFQLSMLVAVAEVESQFEPTARSRADAHGLLQVLPSTAASLRLDPDDPTSNVLAGARYLKLLLARFQSTDLALAAYNAGPSAVDRAGGLAPTGETLTYIANVQARWRALAGCR